MPLHPECNVGHILCFEVTEMTAAKVQEEAFKIADKYFGDLEYEMMVVNIEPVIGAKYGMFVEFKAQVQAAIKYQDQFTKAMDRQRHFAMYGTPVEGIEDTPSGGYV